MAAVCIALLNQKGGVGKSSCVYHLAGAFSKKGLRVLAVDLDPQSSLSQGFWGPPQTRALKRERTIDAVFRDGASAGQVVHPSGIDGIDLIPGHRHAATFNVPDPHAAPPEHQFAIRGLMDEVADDYDLALLDCPPNLYLASWSALVASQFVVCPLAVEDFAAQGLIDVQESIALVKSGPNPALGLLGYLVGMRVARKKVHDFFEEQLRADYGPLVFAATIPHATDFPEAVMYRKPVSHHKPRGAASKAMLALADEILARIADARKPLSLEAA